MQYANQSTILIATCVVLIILVGTLASVATFLDKRIWKREQILLKEAESALLNAHKMEAVGEISGGIAHDFNNLLTIIIGNLELLEEDAKQNDVMAEAVAGATDAANRGADLTSRLLAFSRRQVLMPKVIAIDRLVIDIEPLLRRALGEQVDLTVVNAKNLWLTEVDPSQLENAVVNLCINARDAMPTGGQFTIETSNSSLHDNDVAMGAAVTPGEYVLLTVSDNGTGIKKEVLRRIFEPFYTTKAVGRGSGLGLSMVYGFVKQSQGHIDIDSEEGHGTTIRIYLPKSQSATENLHATAIHRTGIPGGKETVLVVEDEAAVRKMAVEHLTALGYRVLEAGTGAEALKVLDDYADVDLLFSDIVMPGGITGVELARHVYKSYPHLRVLLTTGFADSAIYDIGFLRSGAAVLKKPYRKEQLAHALRDVLDRE